MFQHFRRNSLRVTSGTTHLHRSWLPQNISTREKQFAESGEFVLKETTVELMAVVLILMKVTASVPEFLDSTRIIFLKHEYRFLNFFMQKYKCSKILLYFWKTTIPLLFFFQTFCYNNSNKLPALLGLVFFLWQNDVFTQTELKTT